LPASTPTFECAAVDAFSAHPRSCRVTALDHEIFDDTMENLPVIVAVFCVCREVLYCFRGDILKKFDSYVSVVCMDDRLDFIFLYFIVQLWKCHSNPPKVSNVSIL